MVIGIDHQPLLLEVTTQNADLTKGVTYLTRTLFDGQTKELLAFAKIENGRNNGEIFDRQRNAPLNAGYTDTAGYIDEMMGDDRR